MKTFPVSVICDIIPEIKQEPLLFDDIEGNFFHPFHYRAYVNNELFTERTWIWQPSITYLEEILPISAPVGIYPLRFEAVDSKRISIKVRNIRASDHGRIIEHQGQPAVEISDESQ